VGKGNGRRKYSPQGNLPEVPPWEGDAPLNARNQAVGEEGGKGARSPIIVKHGANKGKWDEGRGRKATGDGSR